ncbi:hypothetical protein [Hyphococcus sp. DH-69]|uniref:hypothetical protein n=1 Tax=Hyphococcus formosus TaxID=3143534 RepID=UPI00398AB171
MMKSIIGAAAAFVLASGAAMANDCVLEAEAPVMPDPKTATAEDRAATIAAIKDYQAKLGEYRECVTAISDNVELDIEVRKQALKDFNATVESETEVVKAWQKFSKAYEKANK